MTSGWEHKLRKSTNTPALVGYVATLAMLATFGLWGAIAPIGGAAVAAGTIAAAGRNVQMQHLEGGIVREIRVREGDEVHKGDVVLVLDDTSARTQVNRLSKQWLSLAVRVSRLGAERDGADRFVGSSAGIPIATSDGAAIVEEEQKEFSARLTRFRSELIILGQRLDQLSETRAGLLAQGAAVERQQAVIRDELQRKQALLEKGLINRSDYTELLRIDADLGGQAASIVSGQASTASQIAEAKEQIERLPSERIEDAVTKLNEARTNLRDVEEQLASAVAVLDRTVIRAPADGIVVSSIYNFVGNVIGPGERIMEILPTTSRPLVEARLQPNDIDAVHKGQAARLRLTALNARLTPEVDAVVEDISADKLIDEATKQPYYRALLKISDPLPFALTAGDLHPGMPVQAFITTEDRTFFEYLLRPVFDTMQLAFVEE
ncbi:HlyD family secretion protein (plasmid) [Rhizobium phaseoli]|uniref:Membrane fusion protein (MFP) family protein n=1 Tax=Rhizobium phaseoli TaxID=396 RepID=A0A7X6EVI7_9HYPH|nr:MULTISPECIES: HlyD family type I secretion periplasmic adaptor subunit [Rhizobium]ANL50251.1 HlyD family secretion protein [Rhizobium phaseoli]MDE8757827.1 HlyD family type I secretion periplasmic adaptor subunit [Rhizobium sp. CBK13]NKF09508.1 HlyD family type I secretion periplasmic adaptor subunit [Rhizobium phaseoli]QPK13212.1 HlyD family type I secretion periplasmic adaptor subunit [Rhizobium phaseoli]